VSGAGGTAVVLNPGDFSVVVRALQSVNRGRSLSRASTLVNNNESANLSNTVTVPYATTTLTDGNTITAFGGSEPAGTTITVSPQIAQGGFLVLDYNVSLSSFLGEATSDGLPPPSQSTSINSIATIPDGYSIVLGGLELLTESDADSKDPAPGRPADPGQLVQVQLRLDQPHAVLCADPGLGPERSGVRASEVLQRHGL
jgi:type II secretory pathway component GspD/PulD (secretin)